jgi:hypothetical protein
MSNARRLVRPGTRSCLSPLTFALLILGAACSDAPVAPSPRVAPSDVALDLTTTAGDLDLFRSLLLQLSAQGTLSAGQVSALLDELEAAMRRRKAGDDRAGGNCFGPLLAELQALVGDGTLTSLQAQPLIDAVQQLAGRGVARRTIAAGYRFTCALTNTGMAQCWGINALGQLGDGTTITRLSPVAVQDEIVFRQVTAGSDHACGLTGDGTAYCWGGNITGQLGDGSTIDRRTPTAVATTRRFSSISAGGYHTCALSMTGHPFCWGRNAYAQLGDGTLTSRRLPTPVANGSHFTRILPYYVHRCALDAAGAAFCWGDDGGGSLGDGTTMMRQVPTAVLGGKQFATLSNAPDQGSFTCGVWVGGSTFCWGGNCTGPVGDGTTTTRLRPTRVTLAR